MLSQWGQEDGYTYQSIQIHAIPNRLRRWPYIPINTNTCYPSEAMAIYTNQCQCMLYQWGHGDCYTYQSIPMQVIPMRPWRWLYILINNNACYPKEVMAMAIHTNQYQCMLSQRYGDGYTYQSIPMHAIPTRSWRGLYIPINNNTCPPNEVRTMAIHTNQYQYMLSQWGKDDGYTYQSIPIHVIPMRPWPWLYKSINTNTRSWGYI